MRAHWRSDVRRGVPGKIILMVLALNFLPGCVREEEQVLRDSRRPAGERVEKTKPLVEEKKIGERWPVTSGPGYYSFPAWSPDGKRIAYTCYREEKQDIWVVEVNGDGKPKGEPVNLSNSSSMDEHPSWSPDGNSIVFHSDREGKKKLFLMDADGANPRLLYSYDREIETGVERAIKKESKNCSNPDWSPDGEKIAFVAENNIWVVDKEGKGEAQFITSSGYNDYPAWSPDGSQIAFYSGNGIKLIGVDGSEERRLTGSGGMRNDFLGLSNYPAWSPEGERIIFVSNRKKMLGGKEVKHYDLWLIKADGTGEAEYLTNDEHHEYFPCFSPKGDKVAFQSDSHIWVLPLSHKM